MKSFLNPVRGWHVLVLIVLFFSVTIGVNATFITLAMRTHPGEDVPRSYYQGLNYNETLARRHEQAELGWSARVNVVDGELLVEVSDADGAPVPGLQLTGAMNHPTNTSRDCPLEFLEGRAGLYRAALPCTETGQWHLRAHNNGDAPFEMEHALWLR
ncbi:FixH family protein [Maricaulis sp.]|uniref:FixH family protein n=1 Tax=Maricaulis sp. TaxID=1486257 RepID=UPI001B0F604A|nr:FixH family protein [Maricaulis sp.]MBO6764440.1 FixH family protein [Maricaulis sp.]